MAGFNDNFADAVTLSGASGTVGWDNVGATVEVGEPATFAGSNNTVWFTHTVPATGGPWQAAFDTIGSPTDTVLDVFTGDNLASLALIAVDDDGGEGTTSKVTLLGVADGTVLRVRVYGYSSSDETAVGVLNWTRVAQPPPSTNDSFADRHLLTGGNAASIFNSINATTEAGEVGLGGQKTLWYEWVASFTGTAVFQATFDIEASSGGVRVCLESGAGATTAAQAVDMEVASGFGTAHALTPLEVVTGQKFYIQLSTSDARTGVMRAYAPVVGEWAQGPDQVVQQQSGTRRRLRSNGTARPVAEFPISCQEALGNSDGLASSISVSTLTSSVGAGGTPSALEASVDSSVHITNLAMPPVGPPLPPGAVLTRFESEKGTAISVIASGAFRTWEDHGVRLLAVPSATATVWRTPSQIQSLPLLAQAPVVPSPGFTPFSVSVPLEPGVDQVSTLLAIDPLFEGESWEHTRNTFVYVVTDDGGTFAFPRMVLTYTPPRHRFLSTPPLPSAGPGPPLRHFQRNDGLAIGAPRQINRSSRQRSLRQGPNTYR